MLSIVKLLPLAALLAAGAHTQLTTSSVVLNPSDTAVTTVTYSTCPSSIASVTTVTNPYTSTYTGAPRPGSADVTTYITVCPGFCTGGPSCTGGLGPNTHTITATCPCSSVGPGGVGPGMMTTVAVCPSCGPGGSPVTATIMTPIPGATGGAASAPGAGGYVAPGSPGYVAPGSPGYVAPGSPGYVAPGSPGYVAPGSPGYVAPGSPGSGAAPGGSALGAGAPASSSSPGSSGSGAGAAPGGSAAGAGTPGYSSGSNIGSGAGSASPSGAGSGPKYGNSSDISPSIPPAVYPGSAGAALRLPLVAGLLSSVAGLCGVLAFLL